MMVLPLTATWYAGLRDTAALAFVKPDHIDYCIRVAVQESEPKRHANKRPTAIWRTKYKEQSLADDSLPTHACETHARATDSWIGLNGVTGMGSVN